MQSLHCSLLMAKVKVIPDGSVIELTKVTVDEDFGETFMKPDLFVKNVSNGEQVVALKLDLKSMLMVVFNAV